MLGDSNTRFLVFSTPFVDAFPFIPGLRREKFSQDTAGSKCLSSYEVSTVEPRNPHTTRLVCRIKLPFGDAVLSWEFMTPIQYGPS